MITSWDAMPDQVTRFLYIAQLSIPKELEERFAELYDREHIPSLMQVPGVHSCVRHRLVWSDSEQMPEYLAVYEVDHADVPKSDAWQTASNHGDWVTEIRPHLTVRRHGVFEKIREFVPR